jgi:hypothetical protein
MGMLSKFTWERTEVTCSTLGLARKVAAENKSIAYTGVKKGPNPKLSKPGELNNFYGKNHTKETCSLISEKGKGRVWWWYPETGETTTSRECPGKGWIRGRPELGTCSTPYPESHKSKGSKNHKSRAIYLAHDEWSEEKYFESANQAAVLYGLQNSKLLATAHGKRKHHKGFVARFA